MKMKDSDMLDGLMESMESMKGEKPKAMSIEIEKVKEAPVMEGDVKADSWPMMKEALESIRGQLDSLEAIVQKAYYPEEMKEKGHNPGNHGPEEKY